MSKTATTAAKETQTDSVVKEYASHRELFRRQRQRVKRKQMGAEPGSGYEVKGGVKRRMSPQRRMQLMRRGMRMARSARQQRQMKMGRQRSKSLQGMRPPAYSGKRLKSDVDLQLSVPPLQEGERRFDREHVLQAIEEHMRGNTDEALRRLTIDPKYQLTPIAIVADEIVRKMHSEGISQFVDAEIVEGEALAVYIQRGEGDTIHVTEMLEAFGDVGKVAEPENPISDVQVSEFYIYMVQPTEEILKKHEYKEDADEDTPDDEKVAEGAMPTGKIPKEGGVLAAFGHVGVNRPTMKTYGGVGKDYDVNPPKDDTAHLEPSTDDPVLKRLWTKRKEKAAAKMDFPLGVDPNLGQ